VALFLGLAMPLEGKGLGTISSPREGTWEGVSPLGWANTFPFMRKRRVWDSQFFSLPSRVPAYILVKTWR
jgi:hypothetical protein